MDTVYIFRRVEKKYLLTGEQKQRLLRAIGSNLVPDSHGRSTVCSLYLDTPDHLLIRNSLDATVYKEKLRIRSYGTPHPDDPVFLEIKKKYKGVVYKRRVVMPLSDVERYLLTAEPPVESQIMAEIEYAMRLYHRPQPAMLIACEREAYFVKNAPFLRITFDTNIRYRTDRLRLPEGTAGIPLLPEDRYIMEVKTDGAMPLWLSYALSEASLYPIPFSKYGKAYLKEFDQYVCNV